MSTHPPTTHPNALPIGFSLREYRIQDILGVGGFGITYRAKHENFSQKYVAIKEYLPAVQAFRNSDSRVQLVSGGDQSVFDWGLERFFEEANNLHLLRHPSIVNVENVFKENGTAYMVMDVVQGVSTAEIIRDKETLTETQLWSLFEQLTSALQTVHATGLIHRDITPSNILFRKNARRAVLIDFGSSREQLEQTQLVGSTNHTRIFTPGYAPIEQHEGTPQDQRSDIYGLSASLYHLALHIRPAAAAQRAGALRENTPDPLIPAVVAGRDKYSPRLLEAIDTGLKLLPADRPASVKAWSETFRDDATETTRLQGMGSPLKPSAHNTSKPKETEARKVEKKSAKSVWDDLWGNPPVRWSGIALTSCLVVMLLSHATGLIDLPGLTSADRLLDRANTALLADPMTKEAVAISSGYFTNAKLLGGEPTNQARAGEVLCENIELFQSAVQEKNLTAAAGALNLVEDLIPQAGVDPDVGTALTNVLKLESLFDQFSKQLQSYTLTTSDHDALRATVSATNAAADAVRSVDDARLQSLQQTVDELSAARKALGDNRFGESRSQLAAALQAAEPAAYSKLTMQTAANRIRLERDKFVAAKTTAAAKLTLAEPTNIESLKVARNELSQALNADVDAEAARNWAAIGQGFMNAALTIQNGKAEQSSKIISDLTQTANAVAIPEEQWRNISVTFSALGTLTTLETQMEELSATPLATEAQTKLRNELSTAQSFVNANPSSADLRNRIDQSRRLLVVLKRNSELLTQFRFAAAKSYTGEVADELAAMPSGAALLANLTSAIDDLFSAERNLRERNAIAAITAYTLDDTRSPLEAVSRNIQTIDSENPTAQQLLSLKEQLDTLSRLTRNREFSQAQISLQQLTESAAALKLDNAFTANQQNWLQSKAQAASDELVDKALGALAQNPLSTDAAADFATALTLAKQPLDAVGLVAGKPPTKPDLLTTLLPNLKELRLTSASGQFDAANGHLGKFVQSLRAITVNSDSLIAGSTAALRRKQSNYKTELHFQVTDALDQAYLTLRNKPLSDTAHAQVESSLAELGAIRDNLDAGVYNWEALAETESALATLKNARETALDKLEYLQATKIVVNASMQIDRSSRWQRVFESGRTELEREKNEEIGSWLEQAGNLLAAEPFTPTALTKATESYAKVVQLEGSTSGKGQRGLELTDYLTNLAKQTRQRATGALDLGQLNDSEDRFSYLPGAAPALAVARSRVQDLFTKEDAALLNEASKTVISGTKLPVSASGLQTLSTKLEQLRSAAKAKNLQGSAASADNAYTIVASAQRAQSHIENKRFESAYKELRSGRAALRDSQLPPSALESLNALRDGQMQAVRQQRVNNLGKYHKDVETAVDILQQGPMDNSRHTRARQIANAVLRQHAEFDAALRVIEIIDILASLGQLNREAGCVRAASARQLSMEIKYPMSWAWLDEVRDKACIEPGDG